VENVNKLDSSESVGVEEKVENVEKKKRNPLKFVLIFLLFLFIGIVGFGVYEYFRIKPNDVRFTNVTSSSVTVSWNTGSKTSGSVKVYEGDSLIPVSLFDRGNRFFDTRDVKEAELLAVQETSNNIVENDDLTVSAGDFQTDMEITDMGEYYTHHVTVTGLEPETEYSFMVGDKYLFREVKDVDGNRVVSTLQVPEEIKSPVPAYGTVKDANNQEDVPIDELTPVTDAVIYFNYLDEFTGERSSVYSSSFNSNGNWYIDVSNAVGEDGKHFVSRFEDTFTNLWVELTIDAGPLGKWKKVVIFDQTSPTDLIVINDPLMFDDEEIGISRIDAKVLDEVVKGVEAEGECHFAEFCGPCYGTSLADRCTCPESTLKARNCKSESTKTMEKVIQEANDRANSSSESGVVLCSGGGSLGDYLKFGNECKQCVKHKKGYGVWKKASDSSKCDGVTDGHVKKNEEESTQETNTHECSGIGAKKVQDGKCYVCKQRASDNLRIWDETKTSVCVETNTHECPGIGAKKVQDGKCYVCKQRASDNLRIWDETKTSVCVETNTEIVETTQENTEEEAEGDVCNSVGESQEIGGVTYDCEDVPTKEYPIWIARDDGEKMVQGPPEECWEYGGNTYRNVDDMENRMRCVNGRWIPSRDYTSEATEVKCEEGADCDGYNIGDICINSEGEELECNHSTSIGREFSKVTNNKIKEIFVKSTENIGAGQRCKTSACICSTSGSTLAPWEYCPEVSRDCGKVFQEVKGGTVITGQFLAPIVEFLGGTLGQLWVNQSGPHIKLVPASDTFPVEGKICSPSSERYTCQNGSCLPSNNVKGVKNELSVRNSFAEKLIFNAVAETEEENDYIMDSETGIFSYIEPGEYVFVYQDTLYSFTINSDSGDFLIYVDSNNNQRYDDGDILVTDLATQIRIITVNKKYNYELKTGFNFVAFPFLIFTEEYRTASGLLTKLNEVYNDAFYSISKYDGRWKIVGQNVEIYDNNDFQLLPGEGYVIKSKRDINISIVGQPVQLETDDDKSPIYMTQGWNLIGLYGTGVKTYTAKSMLTDINASNFTADNVSKWEKSKQMYEGFQMSEGQEYGFDYPINPLEAVFVRILEGRGNWQPKLRTQ
jgi:hypothetical protein